MDKKNIAIIALSCVIVVLLIACTVLYMKYDFLEEKYDDDVVCNCPNTNYSNNKEDSNNKENNNDKEVIEDNTSNKNFITKDEALDKALKSLKIDKKDIYDLDNELDYKYGKDVYDIDFKYNRYEYEVYVDAKTGDIVKSFKERD